MHVTQPILVIVLLLSFVTDEIYAFLPSLNSIHQQSITRFNVVRYTDQTSDQDTISASRRRKVAKSVGVFINLLAIGTLGSQLARAEDDKEIIPAASVDNASVDFGSFKVPYFHSNIPVSKVLGEKATVVVNMKLDDPQTAFQFPGLTDLYNQYGKRGLNVLIFPTDQGWFEPDDDETCRLKAKEYYQFGDFPHAVVFDKVDLLGPSAHPLYVAMTSALPTPNGYNRITLNYEKFLLDAQGRPVRRYPRKFSPQDMSQDIEALLNDQPLPEATPSFLQFWREAKREVPKSEYSFRFNYNYYNSPNSMYKYNPLNDAPSLK